MAFDYDATGAAMFNFSPTLIITTEMLVTVLILLRVFNVV